MLTLTLYLKLFPQESQEETICISSQEKENSQESISNAGIQEDGFPGADHSQKSVITISSQELEALPTTPTQGIRLGLSKFSVNQNKKPAVTSSLSGSSKQAPAAAPGLGKARVSGLSRPSKKAPALHQTSVLSMFARIVKKADLGSSQGSQD